MRCLPTLSRIVLNITTTWRWGSHSAKRSASVSCCSSSLLVSPDWTADRHPSSRSSRWIKSPVSRRIPESTSIWRLVMSRRGALSLSSSLPSCHVQQRTFVHFARGRRALGNPASPSISRAASSIVSFLVSCAKEETSRTSMAPEVNQFTERSSMMNGMMFSSHTASQDCCRWQTRDPTRTEVSSSSQQPRRIGSTVSTLSLDRLWRE
mmetsp:Transcript_14288/g.39382  ORF Transcript_14288/g.39382 Transcript_14288/m.39382 type:complete len:208 (+) Transcript_14288:162-785(+)